MANGLFRFAMKLDDWQDLIEQADKGWKMRVPF